MGQVHRWCPSSSSIVFVFLGVYRECTHHRKIILVNNATTANGIPCLIRIKPVQAMPLTAF